MSGAFPGCQFVLLGHSGAYTDMLCVSSAPTPFPPHPVLELPPLSPLCLSSQAWSIRPFSVLEFQSLPLTGPFSACKQFPCSLTNLHKLIRWHVNSLLYTCYELFFFCSLFLFWFCYPKVLNLVLISFEKLHPSKDDINVVLF